MSAPAIGADLKLEDMSIYLAAGVKFQARAQALLSYSEDTANGYLIRLDNVLL